jgi:hypothetical protein
MTDLISEYLNDENYFVIEPDIVKFGDIFVSPMTLK